ncbi:MAG TPA: sigma 54-interacting transcriptional regulator [Polyangia bacterium]|nr:sigma 54-interacting transcriptional regulator [Polyangia bacterium]
MSVEVGTTTVTHSAGVAPGGEAAGLAIAWRFPRANLPPVALEWDGDGERVLGRDGDCAVQLDGHDVSRRHAALHRSGPGSPATIVDLQSRNGVRINGRPISLAPLAAQDVVRIGGWVGVVTAAPAEIAEIVPGFWGGATLGAALAPVRRVAASDLPIVLEGETGTGKEMVAGALHAWSGRRGPLVAVNCAALPETLAEGELFGYRKGAFTGADRANPGFFRSADGGTLLLDEISDLPLALQAKLLRVLEQREVQPLGEPRPIPVDVRVVVAGQQSLMDSARTGRFRPDLLARLDGLTVKLPPLRARREDVIPLFSRFLETFGQGRAPAFESDLAERLCVHDWPFNVRELVLLARRLLALHQTDTTLRAHHLPERIGQQGPAPEPRPPAPVSTPRPPADATSSEPVQLPALVVALRASAGNVARAAAMLGISRQRAYRLMEGQAIDLEAMRVGHEESPR